MEYKMLKNTEKNRQILKEICEGITLIEDGDFLDWDLEFPDIEGDNSGEIAPYHDTIDHIYYGILNRWQDLDNSIEKPMLLIEKRHINRNRRNWHVVFPNGKIETYTFIENHYSSGMNGHYVNAHWSGEKPPEDMDKKEFRVIY